MAMRDYIAGGVTGRLWNESRGEGKIYLKFMDKLVVDNATREHSKE